MILATSGACKSVTAKLFLHRLLTKELNTHVYIIDPQVEYEPLSNMFNASVLRLSEYDHYGLEPYKLFDKEAVADVIADIAGADNIARKEIRAKSMEADSIFDLYDKLEYAKPYLQDLVREPIATLFKGELTELSERTILSLRGTYGEERIGMLLTLALAKA